MKYILITPFVPKKWHFKFFSLYRKIQTYPSYFHRNKWPVSISRFRKILLIFNPYWANNQCHTKGLSHMEWLRGDSAATILYYRLLNTTTLEIVRRRFDKCVYCHLSTTFRTTNCGNFRSWCSTTCYMKNSQ